MHPFTVLLILICIPDITNGQILLRGKVMDSKSDEPLGGATIFNKSQKILKRAAWNGDYSIIAMKTDSIVFSSVGYRSDTIEVSSELLKNGLYIGLKSSPVKLAPVTVRKSYAQDSLQRRDDYRYFYGQVIQGITGGNTPSHGFGITISPFSFFSKKEKARRRFRKRLEYNEQQAFIDYYFSPSYVHRITGLSGEQLRIFMRKYRPSYQFVRSSGTEDMLLYINTSYKKFKKNLETHSSN